MYYSRSRQPKKKDGLRLSRRHFEQLVVRALQTLPKEFRSRLDNVSIIVETEPSPETLAAEGLAPGETLLGLYEGVPLTERGSGYGSVLPDKLTIYQGPVERACRNEAEIRREVQRTVIHEVGHYFGLSDADLERLGWE